MDLKHVMCLNGLVLPTSSVDALHEKIRLGSIYGTKIYRLTYACKGMHLHWLWEPVLGPVYHLVDGLRLTRDFENSW